MLDKLVTACNLLAGSNLITTKLLLALYMSSYYQVAMTTVHQSSKVWHNLAPSYMVAFSCLDVILVCMLMQLPSIDILNLEDVCIATNGVGERSR